MRVEPRYVRVKDREMNKLLMTLKIISVES